tara:strand:+ start:486 stop:701 length:216 start_codon:yes stop_codon:yes gene_type:complete
MPQTNNEAPTDELFKLYSTLSDLADKFSLKAENVKVCSDEWYELIGQRKAYRQAAIKAIETYIKVNADSNS